MGPIAPLLAQIHMRPAHWALQKLTTFGIFVALPGLVVLGLWKGQFFHSVVLSYVCILAGPCLVLWLVFRDWKADPNVD